jgi:predicted lipoprotein
MVARSPLLILAAATPAPAPNAKAQEAAKAALAVADEYAIPAYRALAEAASAQDKAWAAFVAKRETADIAPLRAAYNTTCDAWAYAQIVKTGPITLFLRYDRIAYWPEARNVTGRALAALLASGKPDDLKPETLAHDSVAGQGLNALERILYDGDNAAALLKAPGKDGAWRAAVGQGIVHNIAVIAHDVLADWTAPDGVRAAIAANKGWKMLFMDSGEAARLLLTDLVAGFKLMHDVKLLPVLGANLGEAKPKAAEAWRSVRPTRDLKFNLAGTHAMAKAFAEPIPAAHRVHMEALFAAAAKAVDAMPADMGEAAADRARRPKVEAARLAIKAVQTDIAAVLPADLGITLGFNSLDGD